MAAALPGGTRLDCNAAYRMRPLTAAIIAVIALVAMVVVPTGAMAENCAESSHPGQCEAARPEPTPGSTQSCRLNGSSRPTGLEQHDGIPISHVTVTRISCKAAGAKALQESYGYPRYPLPLHWDGIVSGMDEWPVAR